MKKWVSLVFALLMGLSLLGCGKKETPTLPKDGFTCQVSVQYKEMLVEGRLTCADDGSLSLACTQPKSLKSVTFGWDGGGMTVGLGEMQVAIPAETAPQGALIACLAQVLAADHGEGTVTDAGYLIEGQAGDMAYTLVCDPETGLPVSLTVPQEELSAAFDQVTLLSQDTE